RHPNHPVDAAPAEVKALGGLLEQAAALVVEARVPAQLGTRETAVERAGRPAGRLTGAGLEHPAADHGAGLGADRLAQELGRRRPPPGDPPRAAGAGPRARPAGTR